MTWPDVACPGYGGPVPRFVVTGAPGTGKTTVIDLLAQRFDTVAEPARLLIAEHASATGEASLDARPVVFVDRLVARSIENFHAAQEGRVVFYDRGLPDCLAYAAVLGVDPEPVLRPAARLRYDNPVFIAPPWEVIYTTDAQRRATFDQVRAFHHELESAYSLLGYELVTLAQTPPDERVGVIIDRVGGGP